jgi:hypothetical protein
VSKIIRVFCQETSQTDFNDLIRAFWLIIDWRVINRADKKIRLYDFEKRYFDAVLQRKHETFSDDVCCVDDVLFTIIFSLLYIKTL